MPNVAHIHLLMVHAAPTALWLGLLLLILSYFHPGEKAIRLATLIVILMAVIGIIIASNSGESAADFIETMPGISKQAIHDHEELGELLLPFALISALLAAIWFTLGLKKEKQVRGWSWWVSTLLIAGTAILTTFASNLGGKIRHPEVLLKSSQMQIESHSEHEDSD